MVFIKLFLHLENMGNKIIQKNELIIDRVNGPVNVHINKPLRNNHFVNGPINEPANEPINGPLKRPEK